MPARVIPIGWGRSIPPEVQGRIIVTWAARAFYQKQVIDILPERQSWCVAGASRSQATQPNGPWTEADKVKINRLATWVNSTGLPFLRNEAKKLFPDECRVVEFDAGAFHIEASPQSSCGYLYIRAWEARPEK